MARGGFRPGAGRPRKSGAGSAAKPKSVPAAAESAAPKAAAVRPQSKAQPVGAAAQRVLEAAAKEPAKEQGRKFRDALDFAMAVMNGEVTGAEMGDKVRLAVAAMPFQHAKLAEKADSLGDQKGARAKAAASGKYAPPPPPLGSRPKVVVSND